MAFLENLWQSVFTPGTTPTLLLATNATFALLQVLLLTLLLTTQSIHFAILSVICAGLWWSINWFANELKLAQAKEDEAEKLRRRKKGGGGDAGAAWRKRGEVEDSADDEGSGEDTEVEEAGVKGEPGAKGIAGALQSGLGEGGDEGLRSEILDAMKNEPQGGKGTGVQPGSGGSVARLRVTEDVDRSGEISTDSEWEKVSQQGDS